MLFDLRSRGRRRTVQVIYIGLAVLIGAGLILFGVGTGSGGGGLFGAFTGNGSGNNNNNASITAAVKKAEKATGANPKSAPAWASLISARLSSANTTIGTSGQYSAAGKQQLAQIGTAWTKYQSLTSKPNPNTATLAARAYGALAQYSAAADAWQSVLASQPQNVKALECVAVNSYAAKNTRVGQLAENKVLSALPKTPKTTRTSTKAEIEAAKKSPSVAGQLCAGV